MEYKKGDLVYYSRKETANSHADTIPCEVVKVNPKTLVLNDGFDIYRNVRTSSVDLQSEIPAHCS